MTGKNEGIEKDFDELEQAYLELGKLYYEYKFEDPTPELLPVFDRITQIKKNEKQQKKKSLSAVRKQDKTRRIILRKLRI